jgi:hypothetical protein
MYPGRSADAGPLEAPDRDGSTRAGSHLAAPGPRLRAAWCGPTALDTTHGRRPRARDGPGMASLVSGSPLA